MSMSVSWSVLSLTRIQQMKESLNIWRKGGCTEQTDKRPFSELIHQKPVDFIVFLLLFAVKVGWLPLSDRWRWKAGGGMESLVSGAWKSCLTRKQALPVSLSSGFGKRLSSLTLKRKIKRNWQNFDPRESFVHKLTSNFPLTESFPLPCTSSSSSRFVNWSLFMSWYIWRSACCCLWGYFDVSRLSQWWWRTKCPLLSWNYRNTCQWPLVCVFSFVCLCVCVCVMAGQLRGTFEILRLKGKKAAITGFASKKPRVVY